MALKKISKKHNEMLIEQACTQSALTEKKVWESELLEKYIEQGVELDKKNQIKVKKNRD